MINEDHNNTVIESVTNQKGCKETQNSLETKGIHNTGSGGAFAQLLYRGGFHIYTFMHFSLSTYKYGCAL